ncbi:MAG: hypothetical protein QM730_17405 [Anaerolineales bacterium]
MTEIFTHINQISPEWLTECLRSHGRLSQGHVIALLGNQKERIRAVVNQITVKYSEDASPHSPRNLFLKMGCCNDLENDDWEGEVYFYNHFAPECSSITIPCHHAAYASNPARFHILLDDMTSTHASLHPPLRPTSEQHSNMINCLADFHLSWWNDPRLGNEIMPRFTGLTLDEIFPIWEQQLKHYFDFLGDRLPLREKRLYEWAFPRLLMLIQQRRQTKQHLTLIHQDAHPYNFLFPLDPSKETTRLSDWATWEVEFGARDLAYLIALHSLPEQRASIEKALLHQYHDRLISGGVTNYEWKQLWEDYRLFAAWNILIPIEQCYWNVPESIWQINAERSFLAFDDLKCLEILS